MLGICDEEYNTDELIIPAIRALACVLTLARFHVHTSETLSLLKHHVQQFGQLAKVCSFSNVFCSRQSDTLIRRFVNLTPINTMQSSHSIGPKCIPSHTWLRVSAGEESSQAVVLTVGRPFILRTERIIVGQTGRHQPKNRSVPHLIFYTLLSLSTDVEDVI